MCGECYWRQYKYNFYQKTLSLNLLYPCMNMYIQRKRRCFLGRTLASTKSRMQALFVSCAIMESLLQCMQCTSRMPRLIIALVTIMTVLQFATVSDRLNDVSTRRTKRSEAVPTSKESSIEGGVFSRYTEDDEPVTNAGTQYHGYYSKEQLNGRMHRFPSVDERVRLYMSNWYVPPCRNNTEGYVQFKMLKDGSQFLLREIPAYGLEPRIFLINSTDAKRTIWHVNQRFLDDLSHGDVRESYKQDFNHFLLPAFDRLKLNQTIPTLVEQGDYSRYVV